MYQLQKATLIKPQHAHTHTNLPGGWAVLAAAGVDDWLVVIETAKGKFLPDGLPLIPLGLPETQKKKEINRQIQRILIKVLWLCCRLCLIDQIGHIGGKNY